MTDARRPPSAHDLRVALSEARAYAQAASDALARAGLPLPPRPPAWLSR